MPAVGPFLLLFSKNVAISRTLPHSTSSVVPFVLLHVRRLRTRLSVTRRPSLSFRHDVTENFEKKFGRNSNIRRRTRTGNWSKDAYVFRG